MHESRAQVFCKNCNAWVPSSFGFGGEGGYKGVTLIGCKQDCPICGNMISMDKTNTRFYDDQGDGHKFYVEKVEK